MSERPPGVPEGARCVTLAELRDSVCQQGTGSLRLGPRGSYLRFKMQVPQMLFSLMGTARAVLGGGINSETGRRAFALEYAHGLRTPGTWRIMAFTGDIWDWTDTPVWIWTLDDAERERQARIAARVSP
jgi:hypothetical protein